MLSKTLEKRSLADSHRALGIDPLYWKQSEPTAVTQTCLRSVKWQRGTKDTAFPELFFLYSQFSVAYCKSGLLHDHHKSRQHNGWRRLIAQAWLRPRLATSKNLESKQSHPTHTPFPLSLSLSLHPCIKYIMPYAYMRGKKACSDTFCSSLSAKMHSLFYWYVISGSVPTPGWLSSFLHRMPSCHPLMWAQSVKKYLNTILNKINLYRQVYHP